VEECRHRCDLRGAQLVDEPAVEVEAALVDAPVPCGSTRDQEIEKR
jgi:hypothetical protein